MACDFFTVNLLDGTHFYVLAVIEHATRRIRIMGITLHPTGEWTTQQARNLVMDLGEQAHRARFMIRDRGSNFTRRVRCRPRRRRDPDRAGQFTSAFDAVLAGAGIEAVKIPPRSPRANAYAERFVLTARTELTDRMLVFGERHLRTVLAQYEVHYNGRRPIAAASSARLGPTARRRPLPQVDPAPARPRRPHQRVRASRIEAQVRTGGRVLEPHREPPYGIEP